MDAGQHCHWKECNRLDFLPLTCPRCSAIFCKDHIQLDAHQCPNQIDNVLQVKPSQPLLESKCTMQDCSQASTVWVECENCNKLFCLKHRNQLDHDCIDLKKSKIESKSEIKLRTNVNGSTGVTKRKGPMSNKGKKTAAIVAAMKLKMSATGSSSIPQEERLYFNVVLPDKRKFQMFFSSKWAGGKILDNILNSQKTLGSNSRMFKLRHEESNSYVNLNKPLQSQDIETGETLTVISDMTS